MRYECQGQAYEFRLHGPVHEFLQTLERRFPREMGIVLGVSSFGIPRRVSRKQLQESVQTLLRALENSADFPFLYYLQALGGPNPDPEPHTGGGIGGIRLPDDPHYYALACGLDYCRLTKYGVSEISGRGYEIETIDIRDWTELATANHGVFQITRRKETTALAEPLSELAQFLEPLTSDTVAKILY
jgi:hypothetical protein